MILDKYYEYYKSEIDFASFQSLGNGAESLLLLLRLWCNESFSFNGKALSLSYKPTVLQNSIVITTEAPLLNKFTKNDKLSMYFNQNRYSSKIKGDVQIYTNESEQSTWIRWSNGVDVIELYFIVVEILPVLLPWIYRQEEIHKRRELLATFACGSHELRAKAIEYELEEIIDKLDLEHELYMEQFKTFEDVIIKQEKDELQYKIFRRKEILNTMLKEIARSSTELAKLENDLKLIRQNKEYLISPITDLREFLDTVKDEVKITHFDSTRLRLRFQTRLENFDITHYESYVLNSNGSSYLFDGAARRHSPESLKKLYKAIFETKKIKIYMVSEIQIDLTDGTCTNYTDLSQAPKWYIKHPHMSDGLFCINETITQVTQYIAKRNYIAVVNCLLYTARQFTISDPIPGGIFRDQLFNLICCNMPNGARMTAKEAMSYIEEYEKEFE